MIQRRFFLVALALLAFATTLAHAAQLPYVNADAEQHAALRLLHRREAAAAAAQQTPALLLRLHPRFSNSTSSTSSFSSTTTTTSSTTTTTIPTTPAPPQTDPVTLTRTHLAAGPDTTLIRTHSPSTSPTDAPPSLPAADAPSEYNDDGSLSTAAKIGVGVGVGLGLTALLVGGFVWLWVYRKRVRERQRLSRGSSGGGGWDSAF